MFRECWLRAAALGALGVLILGPVAAGAQSAVPSVRRQTTTAAAAKKQSMDPKAIETLKAVGIRLAAAKTLSLVAVQTVDGLSHRSEVTLQRPDKLRVIVSGDGPRSQSFCNGNTLMTYSPVEKSIVIAKAPPTINECLRDAYKAAAIDFPLVDLIVADRYVDLIAGLKHASYVGQSQVAGKTNTDIIAFSGDNVSVKLWVGTEDKLPRLLQAAYLEGPNRLRRSVVFSDWKIDVPVRPDVFTSLKADNSDHVESAEPHPIGTSGVQRASRVRPLTIHTFSAKYWGYSPPVGGAGSAYTNYYGAVGYYQSPDGYTYYAPTNYAPYPGVTAGYYGAPCYDCGNDYWATENTDETAGGFNLSLSATTPDWYNAGVPAGYTQTIPANVTNLTYELGQIVTTLPVGCAAYTRGPAFYLCGSTWFSGVYGPNGELYFRVISVPY
jgi:hypothetical protein